MENSEWLIRDNVRDLVSKHGEIYKEAAVKGTIKQAQLDVDDELNSISNSLSDNDLIIFSRLYSEESSAAVAITERRIAEINLKAAEIRLKAEKSNAGAEAFGQIIGALILVIFMFVIFGR